MIRSSFLRPLATSILGIALMLPASFFLLTMLTRIFFGAKAMYYYIAPSFLQSPMHLFAFHKAQCIIGSLVLAVLFNILTIFRLDIQRGSHGPEVSVTYKKHWLNTAIAMQGILLLLILIVYTIIQHIRY